MSDVQIQRGTPRKEKRDVSSDPQWLKDRIEGLKQKKAQVVKREQLISKELELREEQLAKLATE